MARDDGEVGRPRRSRRLRPQASLDPEDDSKVGRPCHNRRLRPQASLDPEDDGKVGRPRRSRRLRPQASLDPEDDGKVGRQRRSRRLRPQGSLDPKDDGEVGRPRRSRRLRAQACLDPEDDGEVGRPRRSRRLRAQACLDPKDDGEVGRPRRSRRLRAQACLDLEDDGEVGRPRRSRRLRPHGQKIRSKVKDIRKQGKRFKKQEEVSNDTSSSSIHLSLIRRFFARTGSALSDDALALRDDASSAESVHVWKKEEWSVETALAYMNRNGATISELLSYAAALRMKGALAVFGVYDTFEERKRFLLEITTFR